MIRNTKIKRLKSVDAVTPRREGILNTPVNVYNKSAAASAGAAGPLPGGSVFNDVTAFTVGNFSFWYGDQPPSGPMDNQRENLTITPRFSFQYSAGANLPNSPEDTQTVTLAFSFTYA